ncbi:MULTISPECIES: quinone oxidoreductase family protein [Pseudovibrio]|uniref:quinone oxidoreductase family protein n=1 Tax=Stappiaceae TaxID=2821832 RepID=UPI002367108D|nr:MULTISPECIES: quinone oxidoreductase [Pseudovibrio]MDD7908796.1 quinone oxidoreductase [Pseudovibrio exalbescens]MDX5593888.1 quinone oxidoreductase [Pseudovibrio sp. SPO723]
MVNAIRVHETGGPDVLKWETIDLGPPAPGDVRIRHTAVGLNFIDTYFRSGLYPAPFGMPFIPGNEGAGVVIAVGPDVTEIKEGDRVAYAGPLGAYTEERNIPAANLVKVPSTVSDETAAGMMLKGMTARYLLKATYPVGEGTTMLFHAAAGGVGLIAGQWASKLGAVTIGTVGSEEKAALAKANGYQHVINYRSENWIERVLEITGGKKCDVVYDSIGKDTFPGSLDCLKHRGMWVSFGQSSGPLPEIDLGILARKGSLFATRPTLFNYIEKHEDLVETASDLFEVVASGAVNVPINQRYALKDAAHAHRDLEGRRTTGTTVLIP